MDGRKLEEGGIEGVNRDRLVSMRNHDGNVPAPQSKFAISGLPGMFSLSIYGYCFSDGN